MSWSISFIGTPENVCKAIDTYAKDWNPSQSKEEYEVAKPHLIALVQENLSPSILISVEANGHATIETKVDERDSEGTPIKTHKEKIQGTCQVSIKQVYGVLV